MRFKNRRSCRIKTCREEGKVAWLETPTTVVFSALDPNWRERAFSYFAP
jgi:hypothetical protein